MQSSVSHATATRGEAIEVPSRHSWYRRPLVDQRDCGTGSTCATRRELSEYGHHSKPSEKTWSAASPTAGPAAQVFSLGLENGYGRQYGRHSTVREPLPWVPLRKYMRRSSTVIVHGDVSRTIHRVRDSQAKVCNGGAFVRGQGLVGHRSLRL
jgi:hypothetical protein